MEIGRVDGVIYSLLQEGNQLRECTLQTGEMRQGLLLCIWEEEQGYEVTRDTAYTLRDTKLQIMATGGRNGCPCNLLLYSFNLCSSYRLFEYIFITDIL